MEFTPEQHSWLDEIAPAFFGIWDEIDTRGLVIKKELDRFALHVDGIQWMTSHNIDLLDHRPIQRAFSGDIILTGLGLGVGILMADLNPKVNTVTVVENDSRVIDAVMPMVLPKLSRVHVQLIETDADNLNTCQVFDFAYLDHAQQRVPDQTVKMYGEFCGSVWVWWDIRQELGGN